jgi:hypothetical protein
MIKQHFGPGNQIHFLTSSKKADFGKGGSIGDDFDDDDDEEGLDEREPEKAICPDNQKMLYKAFSEQLRQGASRLNGAADDDLDFS